MDKYVLFSPLGMTDPTRGFRDGAFIHICRLYKPVKVYLFMSKEICEFDKLDNRYEICLKKLCEKVGFECTVEKIKRPQLVDVNDFDAFYSDFSTIIERIREESPGCDVLINLSSGTPQMKCALKFVTSLSPRQFIPVQVSTPVKKSNHEKPVDEKYDIDLEWELDEDNDENMYVNRCVVSKSENFNALIKREIIEKHIRVYDYKAALTVAQTITDFIDPRMMNLIKAGEYRLMLDTGRAEMFARDAGYDLLPIKQRDNSSKEKITFEYILILKIKLEKEEIADFVRAVSPILTDMFELYLKKKCGIDIEKYLVKIPEYRTLKLTRNLMPDEVLNILDKEYESVGGFKDSDPCAANLYPLIVAKGDKKAGDIASALRLFERNARNIAAHDVVAVTEDWIKDKTGFEASEIFKMLTELFSLTVGKIPKDAWDSYDRLNDAIIKIPLVK